MGNYVTVDKTQWTLRWVCDLMFVKDDCKCGFIKVLLTQYYNNKYEFWIKCFAKWRLVVFELTIFYQFLLRSSN